MINLLSPQEKKNLKEEKKLKLVLVLGISFLAFLVSLSLILFAIRIIIFSQVEIQRSFLEQEERELQNPQIKELQEIMDDSNKKISKLKSFYQQQFDFTSILEEISKTLPPEIYLTNISLNYQTEKDGKKFLTCNLSGFSPTREILLQFKKNLENEATFKEVYFPPSNWMASTDINFSTNFKIIY